MSNMCLLIQSSIEKDTRHIQFLHIQVLGMCLISTCKTEIQVIWLVLMCVSMCLSDLLVNGLICGSHHTLSCSLLR